jgi:diguanylate cyclase (GGDEF)-like protein/PAS domain S-box-containing protein
MLARWFARLNFGHSSSLIGLMGPLLLCAWGFVGFWSWWERENILSSNEQILEQLTTAAQAQTKGLFQQAESTLISANHWISAHPDKDSSKEADFIALIEPLQRASQGMLELRMATHRGALIQTAGDDPNTAVNVSDREYFRVQIENPTRGLYVGAPVKGRATKRTFIPISVRVSNAHSPIAVLWMAMQLDSIAAPFEAQRRKPFGTIGIVRSDGVVLFRSPQGVGAVGTSIAAGQAWQKYMGTQSKGSYESEVSIFDSKPRLVSFARVEGYPLVVYVSESKDDLLQPWRTHTAILISVATLLSVASYFLSAALLRALHASRISEAIIQSTDEAIVGKSLDGIIHSWNPGAERMFGYSAPEMVGQSVLRLLPHDRLNEETAIIEKIKNRQTIEYFETVRVHKDGRHIDVSVTISPILDAAGKLIGASKISRDITAQVNATRQLKLTASVFTNASEGILISDQHGVIVEVNDAFTIITGYSRDDVVGNNPQMFRSSRQGPEVFESIRLALMRDGEWKGELWNRRKNGEAYSVWLTISKVKADDGEVRNYVALFSDVTALKLQQEELEHGAHFDALTDLPNRLLLSDRLRQAITLSQRHNTSLAVLYLDLDGFKAINDRYGHKAGDELLVGISRQMKAALRDVDTLARMGGDEFVAVLTDVESVQDCMQMIMRVLDACARPVMVQGVEMRVTASVGVTMYPQDNADVDQLMRHADQAMYEAKQSGKNRYHLFDSAQEAEVRGRTLQQEQIAHGLSLQEFVLYYQPKVNMRTGSVVGAEALIRWQHPDKGLMLPGAFLPAIERHHLNEALGIWVMEAALQQMSAWEAQGLTMNVSVNIAARQLQNVSFPKRLAELLSNFPTVAPQCLELEILETSALEDLASTATIMEECHRLGVRFAIDDFGTGYSSLTYLRHLPVETLKIDQSFVRDMLEDQGDMSIVKGVIGLAAAFRRDVIAEGVETLAHGQQLIAHGCDLAQGYGIARPMPAGQLAAWCAGWKSPPEWTQAVAQG